MKSFEQLREDLASGRPIKKPVSSNLLKKRAAENKKALDTGFMKMPGYAKKKFNEAKDKDWPRPFSKSERDEFLKKKKEPSAYRFPDKDGKAKALYRKEEELKELKKSTLKSYLHKTTDPHSRKHGSFTDKSREHRDAVQGGFPKDDRKYTGTRVKASEKGIKRAIKKLGGDKTTAGKYIKKNLQDKPDTHRDHIAQSSGTVQKGGFSDNPNKEKNRQKGMKRAIDKLGEEEMKPHKMFKGDKVVVAKNKAEHDKLNKQGYTHDDPKTKKIEEAKDMCSCNCDCKEAICESCGKPKKQVKEGNQRRHTGSLNMNKRLKASIDKQIKTFQDSDTAKQIRRKKTTYGVVAKEAFPDLNEISDHLKTRYIHKSIRDIDTKERASQLADKQGAPASVGKSLSKSTGKRRKGLARARSKLDAPLKEGKKPVVHFKGEDKLKTLKIKLNPKKKIGVKVTDIGPGGKEVVRKNTMKEEQIRIVEALASRYFARDPESNSFNRTKRKETTVRVGQKRDKKTGKMVDVMGKTSAPQGLPQKKR
tara:strand:+ start:801 stop:2402 length:1602 start_codon:yes stop_codon:yes gene_type:complete